MVVPRGDNEAYGFKIYEHRPRKKLRHSRRVRESIVLIILYVPAGQWIPAVAGMTSVGGVREFYL